MAFWIRTISVILGENHLLYVSLRGISQGPGEASSFPSEDYRELKYHGAVPGTLENQFSSLLLPRSGWFFVPRSSKLVQFETKCY